VAHAMSEANRNGTAVELCAWQGEGVGMDDVLDALERLRRGQQRTATRTSVVSLVVVATDEEEARRACEADRLLGGRHPGRTITVRCIEGDEPRIDADVVLEGLDGVWWEEVQLRVAGPATAHLDSLIEPLVLADLPVALWFTGRLPEWDDPLLRAADVVIVDSKEAPQSSAFALIEQLLRHHPVVDLSWVRLRPWRLLLAGLFEGATYRPFVDRVSSVSVAGKSGPRRLLAGWLVARLGLSPSVVSLADDRHVQLRLQAPGATFEVTRRAGERVVRASARGTRTC
jgi:glucose-6-phosphate dehydrogenase assembly protein OpcA